MPELEDGMSDAERHYFQSGGDVKEELTKEPPASGPPAAEPPVVESPPLQPEQTPPAEPAAEAADDADEPETPVRRRVSRKEFESERAARLAAEQQLSDDRVKAARVEERLNLLQQALQEAPKEEAKAPTRPDPEQDIFAYVRWLEEQHNTVTAKVNDYEQRIVAGQEEMESERRYFESMNSYAGQKQDFIHAYNYLLRSRAAELTARSYQVTPEQVQGIMDGRVRIPQPIADSLRQEERDLYRSAFQSNQDPAAQIYSYATMRGYRAPAAAPAAPAGTPGTPLGGGAPAPTAAPRAAAPGGPSVTEVVQSIQRGQPAAASLSRAGGGPTDTELTPQALAEMSEDRFAEILNELQARGDKQKLMQLFGA